MRWPVFSSNNLIPLLMKSISILLALTLLTSCTSRKAEPESVSNNPEPEAISFSGKPLYAKVADSAAVVKSDSLVAAIRSKTDLSEDDFIAIGRSMVGISRFKKAVEIYSEGLGKYPNSYKLLRHRGHRYINLRQLENAMPDLLKAEELIRPEPEVYEYDAAGKQGATYQHQIWYHIGLYHFLKRDYAPSAAAFEKSLATAHAGGDRAGSSDWLYNAYMRMGLTDKAAAIARPFTADFDIENKDYPYYRRLLLFNGVIKPEELVDASKPIAEMTLLEMTKLYGLANWRAYQGDAETANALYKKILESTEWAGFAYASAELDVTN